MKIAAALLAAFLAPALLRAEYKIVLRGGVTYWTKKAPAERNGAYVFTATDGTLLSVRKADVASVGVAEAPRVESSMEAPAEISPVDAARYQHELAKSLRARPKNMPQDTSAYRPGVGVPYPAGANDYVVGKTYAAPPGSAVYSGAAPSEVPSGSAPTGVPSGDVPRGAPAVNATNAPSAPPPTSATEPPPPTATAPPTEATSPTETAPPTAPPPPQEAPPPPPPV